MMTRALRIALANPANDLDAFHHRHPQIEQRHVGMVPFVGFDRLDAIAGLGDHPQVRFLVDDVGDAGAEQRVIVDEQHARLRRGAAAASTGNMHLRRQ